MWTTALEHPLMCAVVLLLFFVAACPGWLLVLPSVAS